MGPHWNVQDFYLITAPRVSVPTETLVAPQQTDVSVTFFRNMIEDKIYFNLIERSLS